MLRKSSNEKRWRKLQESHSGFHKRSNRRVFAVRCVFVSTVCCFMVLAVFAVKSMNAYYEANVIINYHKRQSTRGAALEAGELGYAGISLDSIGNLVLRDPDHKLCATRLFFIERAAQPQELTLTLQGGSELASTADSTLDECCAKCSSHDCHGFRFFDKSCTLLAFPHIDREIDISATAIEPYGDDVDARDDARRGVQQARKMDQHEEYAVHAEHTQDSVEDGAEQNPHNEDVAVRVEQGDEGAIVEGAAVEDAALDDAGRASTRRGGARLRRQSGRGKASSRVSRRSGKAAARVEAEAEDEAGGSTQADAHEDVAILDSGYEHGEVAAHHDDKYEDNAQETSGAGEALAHTSAQSNEAASGGETPGEGEDEFLDLSLDFDESEEEPRAGEVEQHNDGAGQVPGLDLSEPAVIEDAFGGAESHGNDPFGGAESHGNDPFGGAEDAGLGLGENLAVSPNKVPDATVLPPSSSLPEDLQEVDHASEAGHLREFLGVSDTEILPTESDAELMNKLMSEVNGRLNPKKEEAPQKSRRKVEESTNEEQQDLADNLELGQSKLKTVIPLGDYQRLTARDPLYGRHKNLVLRYRSNREMAAVAQDMAAFFKDVEYVTIGKSGDRKKPQVIKSLRVGNGRRGKHVFVVATLRGCEWTSSLAVLHTALVLKGRHDTTRKLLDAVQFHFIGMANPDGFDYSHHKSPSNARSWCKNRRVAVPGFHGVDLEHNWGVDGVSWGFGKRDAAGAKLDSFQGPTAFSEPETRALRDYMKHYATGHGRVALLHVKCCTGVITPPQVYNKDIPNPINVNQVANLMARHVEHTDGSRYSVAQREEAFDARNQGQMIDWAHNEAMIDHAYMIEVKGTGLATRADHTKISVEPFQTLLRELETATVFVALRLLQQPIEGPAVDVPYKVKGAGPDAAASSAAASAETTTSESSSSSSASSSAHRKAADKRKRRKT